MKGFFKAFKGKKIAEELVIPEHVSSRKKPEARLAAVPEKQPDPKVLQHIEDDSKRTIVKSRRRRSVELGDLDSARAMASAKVSESEEKVPGIGDFPTGGKERGGIVPSRGSRRKSVEYRREDPIMDSPNAATSLTPNRAAASGVLQPKSSTHFEQLRPSRQAASGVLQPRSTMGDEEQYRGRQVAKAEAQKARVAEHSSAGSHKSRQATKLSSLEAMSPGRESTLSRNDTDGTAYTSESEADTTLASDLDSRYVTQSSNNSNPGGRASRSRSLFGLHGSPARSQSAKHMQPPKNPDVIKATQRTSSSLSRQGSGIPNHPDSPLRSFSSSNSRNQETSSHVPRSGLQRTGSSSSLQEPDSLPDTKPPPDSVPNPPPGTRQEASKKVGRRPPRSGAASEVETETEASEAESEASQHREKSAGGRRTSGAAAAAALMGHQHHGEMKASASSSSGVSSLFTSSQAKTRSSRRNSMEGVVKPSKEPSATSSPAPVVEHISTKEELMEYLKRAGGTPSSGGGRAAASGVLQPTNSLGKSSSAKHAASGVLTSRNIFSTAGDGSEGASEAPVRSAAERRLSRRKSMEAGDRMGSLGKKSGAEALVSALANGKGSIGRKGGLGALTGGQPVLKKGFSDVREKYAVNGSDEIGRGKFGVIRVCVSRSSGEKFACKTISKAKLQRWQDVEDVQTEVTVMKMLGGCPHVAQLKDTFEDNDYVHLVMELCEGGELFDRIKAKRRYSEGKAASLIRTIATVMRLCHKLGVMHRDIKPENILLTSRDSDVNAKVIDFGVAAFFKQGQALTEVVGTPNYLAPEVLEGNYGPEGDVWSAGVVLYILLSGAPPFWAINQNDGALELMRGKPLDLTGGIWDSISSPAKNLVRRMLCLDPAKRIKPDEILTHAWIAE